MRMGVEPVGSSPILNREFIGISFAWLDRQSGMAISLGGNMQAMPVDNCLFAKLIGEMNPNPIATNSPDYWT